MKKKNKVQGTRGMDITHNRHLEFRVGVTTKSFSFLFFLRLAKVL